MKETSTPMVHPINVKIRNLMQDSHTSQRVLAEYLEVTQGALNQRLRGSSTFSIDDLIKISKYFNVSLTDILSDILPELKENDERAITAGQFSKFRNEYFSKIDLIIEVIEKMHTSLDELNKKIK